MILLPATPKSDRFSAWIAFLVFRDKRIDRQINTGAIQCLQFGAFIRRNNGEGKPASFPVPLVKTLNGIHPS